MLASCVARSLLWPPPWSSPSIQYLNVSYVVKLTERVMGPLIIFNEKPFVMPFHPSAWNKSRKTWLHININESVMLFVCITQGWKSIFTSPATASGCCERAMHVIWWRHHNGIELSERFFICHEPISDRFGFGFVLYNPYLPAPGAASKDYKERLGLESNYDSSYNLNPSARVLRVALHDLEEPNYEDVRGPWSPRSHVWPSS